MHKRDPQLHPFYNMTRSAKKTIFLGCILLGVVGLFTVLWPGSTGLNGGGCKQGGTIQVKHFTNISFLKLNALAKHMTKTQKGCFCPGLISKCSGNPGLEPSTVNYGEEI